MRMEGRGDDLANMVGIERLVQDHQRAELHRAVVFVGSWSPVMKITCDSWPPGC